MVDFPACSVYVPGVSLLCARENICSIRMSVVSRSCDLDRVDFPPSAPSAQFQIELSEQRVVCSSPAHRREKLRRDVRQRWSTRFTTIPWRARIDLPSIRRSAVRVGIFLVLGKRREDGTERSTAIVSALRARARSLERRGGVGQYSHRLLVVHADRREHSTRVECGTVRKQFKSDAPKFSRQNFNRGTSAL